MLAWSHARSPARSFGDDGRRGHNYIGHNYIGHNYIAASGTTVGECKLFAVLHILVALKADVLVRPSGRDANQCRRRHARRTYADVPGTCLDRLAEKRDAIGVADNVSSTYRRELSGGA